METHKCEACDGEGSTIQWSMRNPAVIVRAKCKRCGGTGRLYSVRWMDGAVDLPKEEPLAVSYMEEKHPRRGLVLMAAWGAGFCLLAIIFVIFLEGSMGPYPAF